VQAYFIFFPRLCLTTFSTKPFAWPTSHDTRWQAVSRVIIIFSLSPRRYNATDIILKGLCGQAFIYFLNQPATMIVQPRSIIFLWNKK
jgi:hypothetical protein